MIFVRRSVQRRAIQTSNLFHFHEGQTLHWSSLDYRLLDQGSLAPTADRRCEEREGKLPQLYPMRKLFFFQCLFTLIMRYLYCYFKPCKSKTKIPLIVLLLSCLGECGKQIQNIFSTRPMQLLKTLWTDTHFTLRTLFPDTTKISCIFSVWSF